MCLAVSERTLARGPIHLDTLKVPLGFGALMLDALWVALGAVVGAAGAFGALTWFRRSVPARDGPRERFQLTTGWRVSEFQDPVLVVRELQGVAVPQGALVIASGLVDADIQAACEVRQAPEVRAEFVLDRAHRRALLWFGGARVGSMGLITTDETIVARLENEFKGLWDKAEPYVERYKIAQLSGRTGVTVETEGEVQEVIPWRDAWMLRLTDQGHVLGVLLPKDPTALEGRRVRVRGSLEKDRGGYVVLRAEDVREVR